MVGFGTMAMIALSACTTLKVVQSKPETPADKPIVHRFSDDSLLVGLERTACLGKCPTYKVNIYNGGFFTYYGIKNVLREGDFEGRLSADQIDVIKKYANSIRIFNLNDEYQNTNLVDLPTTYVRYQQDGKLKEITDGCYETPSELIYFEKLVDMTIDTTKIKRVNAISIYVGKDSK